MPTPQKEQLSSVLVCWICLGRRDFVRMPLTSTSSSAPRKGRMAQTSAHRFGARCSATSMAVPKPHGTCSVSPDVSLGCLGSGRGTGLQSSTDHGASPLPPVLQGTFPTRRHATAAVACCCFPNRGGFATSEDSPDSDHEIPK